MFVDACAIVAMMAGEDSAAAYGAALSRAQSAFTSPMAAWQAIIILSRPDQLDCRYSEAETAVVEWLDARGIELRDAPLPHEVLSFAWTWRRNTGSAGARSAISTASIMPMPRPAARLCSRSTDSYDRRM
ncbi:MAG TPA: type II toxin-antitoxin system VapC family toxin [Rhizomicrobium sp.]|jgi:hypothetical protein|nr:type II toxin-antitoxin system VapC family toxin [Rhizomicrobium sp.]